MLALIFLHEAAMKIRKDNQLKNKENLLGLPFENLKNIFLENGFSILDAKRVFPWIHIKLAKSFNEMSDLSKKTREALDNFFSIDRPQYIVMQESSDGTKKALLEFIDGTQIETVFIPDEKRNTICISSQAGCALGCKFCHTGTQGFLRDLNSSEIMSQVFFWKDAVQEFEIQNPITNIVFMGMGEPLLNSQNILKSIELLLKEKSHNFSRNKITVSTSGIVDETLFKLSKFGVKLAVSLHASNDEKRSKLMPINQKYNISSILSASKKYLELSNTENVTFEYLLLSGVNDFDEDAFQLVRILRDFNKKCKVNLIVFNCWNGSELSGTTIEKAHHFLRVLLAKGIRATIRKTRGNDILAACGQLNIKNHSET